MSLVKRGGMIPNFIFMQSIFFKDVGVDVGDDDGSGVEGGGSFDVIVGWIDGLDEWYVDGLLEYDIVGNVDPIKVGVEDGTVDGWIDRAIVGFIDGLLESALEEEAVGVVLVVTVGWSE